MGISGLLPALKSIQVTRHLSDFSGKTIAVDAYVWLHKGVYSCATDIATGKNTHKYVDYAMHRVRLLRHYKIVPYIVFDGGPLPAKKGTESERKQKREENLARGKAFIAQGKHSQARECFIKCVDVTPQMAFQFIKALRAESVLYIVAPYEADAQLAYLERTGVVDAILTEDSDLLVFGCQNVLFKFDSVASTVVSISRKDFGSVAASSSDTNGISLIGWSDVQFRSMAILSGCDYLPSIPGIGLKTACMLLKKWKTAEQVIRAVAMEGKKSVPSGYLKQFKLAEICFRHQRVYCPKAEKLVHLSNVDPDWTEEFDAYVGSDMDPVLAKNVAFGDYDPVTHLPMKDINPGFLPRTLKPLPPVSNSPSKPSKGKGKMRQSLPSPTKPTGGILSFFGPNPIIPPRTKQKPAPVMAKQVHGLVGKASGKRTLAEVMDQDMERKKRHRKSPSPAKPTSSKFFYTHTELRASSIQRRHSDGVIPIAGPSRLRTQSEDKENVYLLVDDNDDDEMVETSEPELDSSDLSLKAQFGKDKDFDAQMEMDLNIDDFPDVVEQEDGYISPSPSCSKDAQDISSPPKRRPWKDDPNQEMAPTGMIPSDDEEDDADFGAEVVSSPISVKKPKPHSRLHAYQTPIRWFGSQDAGVGEVLVEPTPTPKKGPYLDIDDVPSPTLYRGPDLRNLLDDEGPTELGYDDEEMDAKRPGVGGTASGSASPPSPSPETPDSGKQPAVTNVVDVDEFDFNLDDEETRQVQVITANAKAVMNGWREKYALPAKKAIPVHGSGSVQALMKSPPRHHIRPVSPKKAKAFTPGSRPARAFNLKRCDANVTPAGRHTVVSYKPPHSAPCKLPATSTILNGIEIKKASKPRRSLFLEEMNTAAGTPVQVQRTREIVDLTTCDNFDEDDTLALRRPSSAMTSRQVEQEILSSVQMRLSQFRRS